MRRNKFLLGTLMITATLGIGACGNNTDVSQDAPLSEAVAEVSTELKTPAEIAAEYNGSTESASDVKTADWVEGHAFADLETAELERKDVEIVQTLPEDSGLPEDKDVSSMVESGNYILATVMSYINDFIKENDIQEARVQVVNPGLDSASVSMLLDDELYEFVGVILDETSENSLTVYCTRR